jgi:rhomboid protease GluP
MSLDREAHSLADRILESPVTWLITALNFGIFLIAWTQGEHSKGDLAGETLLHYGALWRPNVWRGEYWRLASAVFLHVGWFHLLWNTWAMFGWCASIEKTVGSGWFAFAYLTTGVGASAVSLLCHLALSAGASGAAFGMVGVVVSLLYRRAGSWNAFTANPMVRQLMGSAVLWIAIGFLAVSAMDNFAHLGGFAFGIPCGFLLEQRRGRGRAAWLIALAAYLLVWAGVIGAACSPGLSI